MSKWKEMTTWSDISKTGKPSRPALLVAGLVATLVTLQAYVFPFTKLVVP
jgi:hypothetical protein